MINQDALKNLSCSFGSCCNLSHMYVYVYVYEYVYVYV